MKDPKQILEDMEKIVKIEEERAKRVKQLIDEWKKEKHIPLIESAKMLYEGAKKQVEISKNIQQIWETFKQQFKELEQHLKNNAISDENIEYIQTLQQVIKLKEYIKPNELENMVKCIDESPDIKSLKSNLNKYGFSILLNKINTK